MILRLSVIWHQLQIADVRVVDGETDTLSDAVFVGVWFTFSAGTILGMW